jgi:hypothetical protein
MKGIYSTGAPLVHVPGWMDGWVDGWIDGSKSRFKDCLQQSKISLNLKCTSLVNHLKTRKICMVFDWLAILF